MVLLSLLVATLPLAAAAPITQLGAGHQAFRAGEYQKAARLLAGLPQKLPRSRDYALYFAAESEFYAGRLARARALFDQLADERDSRFAALAPWRVADCLWAEGRKAEAAAAYRKLLAKPPPGVDAVVARFHLAELAPRDEQDDLFRKIHTNAPAHPLAREAARRVRAAVAARQAATSAAAGATDEPAPAPAGAGAVDGPPAPAADAAAAPRAATEPAAPRSGVEARARARMRRASLLVDGKRFGEAVAELEAIPAELPEPLATERDFQLGMAKFSTRHAYAEAAALLGAAAPRLKGDRAAFAAFQATRALARANRDDEAVVAARQVVQRYPDTRWAAEAQFVSGWLDFNRGRFQECVPGLRGTIDRYGKSAFANDAAWYLALAHHFLGHPAEALAALEEYVRLPGADAEVLRRTAYWKGRFLLEKGDRAEAVATWRDLVTREPLSYYGLVARARLRKAGVKMGVELPKGEAVAAKLPKKVLRDPVLLRVEELDRAGLTVEAGVELQRSEDDLEQRLGKDMALALLLERYPRLQAFRRAYQLAETRGSDALLVAPVGGARATWEAALPRAYRPLVEPQARAAGVPPDLVYTIMYKESGFSPLVVSPADARGLLQVMPWLGAKLAARRKLPFSDEDLFRPEVNIRFGVANIGDLLKKFRGQVFLTAAAYNGGTGPVMRWLDRNGRRPFDEFVELIGYRESREYLKRVSAIYARYSYLYTGKPYELPLTVNRAYRKDKTLSRPADEPD